MSGIAITFPTSPIEGQSYLAQNGFTYIYDSLKNRWKRGGDFVRAPKVLSFAGVAVTTTGSGITTGPTGALIYNVPGFLIPSSTIGVDSYKAYRYAESYPNYTEVQVSISSAFSTVAYAATFTGTTNTIPAGILTGNTTYYIRARQFVGSSAASAGVGAISGYSQNVVSFATTSLFLDAPTIVSIAGTTGFPVYQIGFAGTTLPATVTYTGSGVNNLDKVEWRVTGPRIPSSTGDTALAEVGVGTHSSATLANALVLAMPFSGATGVGITSDVNNAIRTVSGASAGTTKTITNAGAASTVSVGIATTTSHFYPSAAYFSGATTSYLSGPSSTDFNFGTGDFTIEFWVYSQATNTNPTFYRRFLTTGPDSDNSVQLGHIVTTTGVVVYYTSTSTITGTRIITNRWAHIALVRKGTIVSLYVDGVLDGTATDSNNKSNQTLSIANYNNTDDGRMQGYMQDLKVYKGLAKYQENFTPPLPTYGTISYTTRTIGSVGVATTAFFKSTGDIPTAEVAIGSSTAAQVASSLVLAMPMNRTFGFQDINVAVRGLTSGASAGTAKTVGLGTTSTANAPSQPVISSTESKWYDGAAYFDGSKFNWLYHPNISDFEFGTGDFTYEFWINKTTNASSHIIGHGEWGTSMVGWGIYTTSNTLYFQIGNNITVFTFDLPQNSWNHIAFTRSGTTCYGFLNGVLMRTGTSSANVTNSYQFTIGADQNGDEGAFTGYLQDLKIYKGFAKYTSSFTPPRPICGFTTDLAIQTGFTTTSATGIALTSIVGLGSTSTLAFSADQNLIGVTSITSSSGITTLPDPYAQNLVLALPLANIVGVGTSFTNDRNTQIRSVSITGAGVTAGTTKNALVYAGTISTSTSVLKYYNNSVSFDGSSGLYANVDAPRTNSYTWECWFYQNNLSTTRGLLNTRTGNTTDGVDIAINTNGSIGITYTATNLFTSSAGLVSAGIWYHFAFCRDGNTFKVYLNGNYIGGFVNTTDFTSTIFDIGFIRSNGNYTNGYLQDVRLYYNLTKYTTNFTPPPPMFGDYTRSTPNKIVFTPGSDYVLEARNTATGGIVTSVYSATRQWGTKPKGGIYDPYASNLVLAIPGGAVGGATTTFDVTGQIRYETPTATYVNAGIVTYSNSLGIGTYGNKSTSAGGVITSTTQSKYYGRSLFWNGGQRMQVTSPNISTTDFTIECWTYYSNAASVNETNIEFISSPRLILGRHSSGVMIYFYDGDYLGSDTVKMAAGTWYHLAFTKKGTTIYGFINGILVVQNTSASFTSVSPSTISFGRNNDNAEPMSGYMNDIRVYTFAKYTSNFTPPNQIYLT